MRLLRNRLARLGAEQRPKKDKKPRIAKLVMTETECWVIRGDGKRDVRAGLSNCAWKSYKTRVSKTSKEIDLTGFAGTGGAKIKTYSGIYQIKENKLWICWNESGKSRPTQFTSDGSMNLFVCERLSKKVEKRPK